MTAPLFFSFFFVLSFAPRNTAAANTGVKSYHGRLRAKEERLLVNCESLQLMHKKWITEG